ncbi:MAG: acyl-CoA dehydrogenase [Ilumatobacteraceae bacterium]
MLSGPTFTDDAPSDRLAWVREHTTALGRVPLPGSGSTVSRLRTLATLAMADGSLARLAEGHLDAAAIRLELGAAAVCDTVLEAVWAARPEQLHAVRRREGWRLHGDKPWCSGARGVDRALVTAIDEDGRARLFQVAVDRVTFADDWHPLGMRASDSRTASIDMVVCATDEIGEPGSYVGRPGFWHGGVGVAACWHGLAQRLAADVAAQASRRDDPYLDAARGALGAEIAATTALLASAGRQIDDDPHDLVSARRRAQVVRLAVARTSRRVLEMSTAVGGAGPLCFDRSHQRAVADLTVYLGQAHEGHDAATVEVPPGDVWWTS